MCGICAIFGATAESQALLREKAVAISKRIRHRGPDWSGIKISNGNVLCHERLSIVGVQSGAQPLTNSDGTIILTVNGEIYNYKKLRKLLKNKHTFQTQSDCEVILHLYEENGPDFALLLDGMFSFVLYDSNKDIFIAARDHIGITTLYKGTRSSDNSVWFASEMKCLHDSCDQIESFPPGHYYDSQTNSYHQYYEPKWYKDINAGLPSLEIENKVLSATEEKAMFDAVRDSLVNSVRKRMMAEVPFGVLLSGGLDSSLIASILAREFRDNKELISKGGVAESATSASIPTTPLETQAKRPKIVTENDDPIEDSIINGAATLASGGRKVLPDYVEGGLHSFSIGLPGSPDLIAAKRVADFLKTKHHNFTFTVEQGLDAITEVIEHLETYDVTTIRASTPMYLLSRKIKAMGVKMVLSGEGSDEIFAGYLYFHKSPSAQALHHECISRIKNLHTSDCLRANKSTMAWGLEARVPFLDKSFLDVAMEKVPANYKVSGERGIQATLPKTNEEIDQHLGKSSSTEERKIKLDLWKKKRQMEKFVLREAFDNQEDPYLPDEILWRQKEQFSDGVGYSWIDSLKEYSESYISDEDFAKRNQLYPKDTPTTKEGFWYRRIFESIFPEKACLESVVRWIPRKDWGCAEDPSGRAQGAHVNKYDNIKA